MKNEHLFPPEFIEDFYDSASCASFVTAPHLPPLPTLVRAALGLPAGDQGLAVGPCGRDALLALIPWDSCLGAQPATSSVQAHLLLWELQLTHALLGPQEASDKISFKTAERRQNTLLHLLWLFPKHLCVIKL